MANPVLHIYKPLIPYTQLSNYSTSWMTINKKRWKTVSHYVYANMLCNPIYKQIIQNTKDSKSLFSKFQQLYIKCELEVFSTALKEAFQARFSIPEYRDILLQTGSSPLIYISDNTHLGILPPSPQQQPQPQQPQKLSPIEEDEGEEIRSIEDEEEEQQFSPENFPNIEEDDKEEEITIDDFLTPPPSPKKSLFKRPKVDKRRWSSQTSSQSFTTPLSKFKSKPKTELDKLLEQYESLPEGEQKSQLYIKIATEHLSVLDEQKSPPEIKEYPENFRGENLVGKTLTQLRHIYQTLLKEQETTENLLLFRQKLYSIYKAFSTLNRALSEYSDLIEYVEDSYDEIVERYNNTHSEQLTFPDEQTVYEMYSNGLLDTIIQQEVNSSEPMIVARIRRKELLNLEILLENKQKLIIFEHYINYLLEKQLPHVESSQYDLARQQLLSKMTLEQRLEIINRVKTLFDMGMLSARLSDQIDEELKKYSIPEKNFEDIEIEDPPTSLPFIPSSTQPIYIYPLNNLPDTSLFSPVAYTGMLNVNGLYYPTVLHYIIARQISNVYDNLPMSDAHTLIMLKPTSNLEEQMNPENYYSIERAMEIYYADADRNYIINLEELAKRALTVKFQNKQLSSLLLLTGTLDLVNDDPNDNVLGIGKNRTGRNYTGNYLMTLRTELKFQTALLNPEKILAKASEISQDENLHLWIEVRVRDMCQTVKFIRRYMGDKYGIYNVITSEEIDMILNHVYKSCGTAFSIIKKRSGDIPLRFNQIVRKYLSGITPDCVEPFWVRISILIFILVRYLQTSDTYLVLDALKLLIQTNSAEVKKCIGSESDVITNCVISALVNIMLSIQEMNELMKIKHIPDVNDINASVSILMGKEVNIGGSEIGVSEDEVKDLIENPPSDFIGAFNWGVKYVVRETRENHKMEEFGTVSEKLKNRINFFATQM